MRAGGEVGQRRMLSSIKMRVPVTCSLETIHLKGEMKGEEIVILLTMLLARLLELFLRSEHIPEALCGSSTRQCDAACCRTCMRRKALNYVSPGAAAFAQSSESLTCTKPALTGSTSSAPLASSSSPSSSSDDDSSSDPFSFFTSTGFLSGLLRCGPFSPKRANCTSFQPLRSPAPGGLSHSRSLSGPRLRER